MQGTLRQAHAVGGACEPSRKRTLEPGTERVMPCTVGTQIHLGRVAREALGDVTQTAPVTMHAATQCTGEALFEIIEPLCLLLDAHAGMRQPQARGEILEPL